MRTSFVKLTYFVNSCNVFSWILLISNHMLSRSIWDNSHSCVFQRAQIALDLRSLWKTHSCELIPNWTRNRIITCPNKKFEKKKTKHLTGHRSIKSFIVYWPLNRTFVWMSHTYSHVVTAVHLEHENFKLVQETLV
jgi:hypothetical protein